MRSIVLLAVAVLASSADGRAGDRAELVIDGNSVASTLSPDFRIALGDPYSPSFIKGRFRPYAVEFSDECEIECFVVSRERAAFNVYGSEESGKVTAFVSWSEAAVDSLGNRIGMPLAKALKATRGLCEQGEVPLCHAPIKGLSYFVGGSEGCEIGLPPDTPRPVEVAIPECATVDGFQVSTAR